MADGAAPMDDVDDGFFESVEQGGVGGEVAAPDVAEVATSLTRPKESLSSSRILVSVPSQRRTTMLSFRSTICSTYHHYTIATTMLSRAYLMSCQTGANASKKARQLQP